MSTTQITNLFLNRITTRAVQTARWLVRGRAYLISVLMLFLLAWLAFNGFETVQRIVHYYNPLPIWDYWRVPENFSRYQSFDLRAFWRQHNEHRIVFPEIVFALDMLVLHGREILPVAFSFLCYTGTWLVLSFILVAEKQLSSKLRSAAILLSGIIVFWEGAATVVGTPFLLQWAMVQFAAVCSFACLAGIKAKASGNAYLAGAIAAAVIATYSSGNGLTLWPLLLGAALILRLNRRELVTLGISAVVFMSAYFAGYRFSNETDFHRLLVHPVYFLGFAGAYLSMPFGGIKAPMFGVYVGLSSLLVTILLFVFAVRRGLVALRPAIVFFGSYAFVLLTILITAAGRMDPTDPTFTTAKAQRYLTVPQMNWAVFIFLCIWISARGRWKLAPALPFLFGLLLLSGLPKLRWWLALDAENFAEQQLATLSIEDGLTDPHLLRKIFPDPTFLVRLLPELRKNRLSIYHTARERWLGKPVAKFSFLHSDPIPGQITETYPVQSGFEVVGWADPSVQHVSYEWVVLGNEAGQLVGFGRKIPAGFPNSVMTLRTPPSSGWVGFVNLKFRTGSVNAYVVDRKRGMFPIAGSISDPLLQSGDRSDAGKPIAGVNWQRDPIWTSAGLPPYVDFGDQPGGPVYNSRSGADENTGKISSSAFERPANGCVILPVLHGPSPGRLSVELTDSDTGAVIVPVPMHSDDTQWRYWRVPLNRSIRHLRVVADDEGRNWGEWLAIATPAQCR